MIITDLTIDYYCISCGLPFKTSRSQLYFTLERVVKEVNANTCPRCRKRPLLKVKHIECKLKKDTNILNKNALIKFNFTIQCCLCGVTWNDTTKVTPDKGFLEVRDRIYEGYNCKNTGCPSEHFKVVSYGRDMTY